MIVYKYTNKINGKAYIGITTRKLKTRDWEHKKQKVDDGTPFHNAIKKYGIENFHLDIIDKANNLDELKEKEKRWIMFYNTFIHSQNSKGYNLTKGGDGLFGHKGHWLGKIRSEETRKKISKARKGRFGGKNHYLYGKGHLLKGENNPNYGKPQSEEQKKRHSETMKGRYEGSKNPRARKVICLTTNEAFNCIKDANLKYGINKADISACCKGKLKSAGKHPITKEKMIWRYYDLSIC